MDALPSTHTGSSTQYKAFTAKSVKCVQKFVFEHGDRKANSLTYTFKPTHMHIHTNIIKTTYVLTALQNCFKPYKA